MHPTTSLHSPRAEAQQVDGHLQELKAKCERYSTCQTLGLEDTSSLLSPLVI